MVKAGDEARKVGRGWVVKAFRVYGKKFRLGPQADGDSLEDFFFFFFLSKRVIRSDLHFMRLFLY